MASAIDQGRAVTNHVYSHGYAQETLLSTSGVRLQAELRQLESLSHARTLKTRLSSAFYQGLFPINFTAKELTLIGKSGVKNLTDLVRDVAIGTRLDIPATFTDFTRIQALTWLARVEFTKFKQAVYLVESLRNIPQDCRPYNDWRALKSNLNYDHEQPAASSRVEPSLNTGVNQYQSVPEICVTEFKGTPLTGMPALSSEHYQIQHALDEIDLVYKKNKPELRRVIYKYASNDLFPLMLSITTLESYEACTSIIDVIYKFISQLKESRTMGNYLRSGVQRSILWLCHVSERHAFTLLAEIDLAKYEPADFSQQANRVLLMAKQSVTGHQQLCAQTSALKVHEPVKIYLLPRAQFSMEMKNYYGVAVSIPYGAQGHPLKGVTPIYKELVQEFEKLKRIHENKDINATVDSIRDAYQQGLFPIAIGEELLRAIPNEPLDMIVAAFVYSFKDFANHKFLRSGTKNAILWLGSINPNFARFFIDNFNMQVNFNETYTSVMQRIGDADRQKTRYKTIDWFGVPIMSSLGYQGIILNNTDLIKAQIEFSDMLKAFLHTNNVLTLSVSNRHSNKDSLYEKLLEVFKSDSKACKKFIGALEADKGSEKNQQLAQRLRTLVELSSTNG